MIQGFEDAVITMKKGDTKTVRIEPKDAYGEAYIEKTMPLDEYREVITQKVPSNVLTGIISQDLPKAQADQILGGSTVGTEKKLGEATIKVTAVTGDTVTVSIDDPQAPFYGKTLAVAMEATAQDGSKVTIKSITGDEVEVDITPDQTVVSKTETEVTVKTKNPHPLAGKALNFEITLNDIKTSTPPAAE
jgi:FKBP-type peptidyl-prolyl cis-trans isomerase 2